MVQPTVEFKVKKSQHNYQMAKDFKSMARSALSKECARVFAIANKRIARLESSDVMSQALESNKEKGGKFYAKGKDLKQLQHEYARCISFLNMKTSTVSGARAVEKNIEKKLGGRKMTKEQKKKVFEIFRNLGKLSPSGVEAYGSDRLIQYIYDEVEENPDIEEGEDWDKLIDKIWNETSKALEARELEFYNRFKDIFSI